MINTVSTIGRRGAGNRGEHSAEHTQRQSWPVSCDIVAAIEVAGGYRGIWTRLGGVRLVVFVLYSGTVLLGLLLHRLLVVLVLRLV